jgi:hypothetical protein
VNAVLKQLQTEHAALLEFARAVRALEITLAHPEATAADEQKAEARYDIALSAVLPLLDAKAQIGYLCSIPTEAAAIGAALDGESLEQGEPV